MAYRILSQVKSVVSDNRNGKNLFCKTINHESLCLYARIEEKALKELANNIAGKENLAQSLLGKDIYQNIFNAFKCIESWFVGENGKDIDLAKFAKYIYKSVCFVFVELAQNTDLNRFFVRMNNCGKQLEKHEILKARILIVIQQGGGEWQKYAKIWDLCSDMNKYIFQSKDSEIYEVESIIDFPTFLLHCFKIDNLLQNFTISKDKLLEFIDIKKLTWNDKNYIDFMNLCSAIVCCLMTL